MTVAKSILLQCSTCKQHFHPRSPHSLKAPHPCCSLPCRHAFAASYEHLLARFLANVPLLPLEQCWPWKGRRNPKTGYGEFDIGASRIFTHLSGHQELAHRVAFFLHNRSIHNDLLVCHSCDFRPCVNYSHLSQGTHKDNAQDMVDKGRSLKGDHSYQRQHPESVRRGEQHPMAKVSDEQADEILYRYQQGNISQRSLATTFDVSQFAIWRIVTEKRKRNA